MTLQLVTGAGTHPSERPLWDLGHLRERGSLAVRSEWKLKRTQPSLGALVGGYCEGWGFFLAIWMAKLEVEDLRPWWIPPACGLDLGDDGRGLSFLCNQNPLFRCWEESKVCRRRGSLIPRTN